MVVELLLIVASGVLRCNRLILGRECLIVVKLFWQWLIANYQSLGKLFCLFEEWVDSFPVFAMWILKVLTEQRIGLCFESSIECVALSLMICIRQWVPKLSLV